MGTGTDGEPGGKVSGGVMPDGPDGEPPHWASVRQSMAAATRLIGYQYQHHHVPDWDPPESWPWKECCGERHGKGPRHPAGGFRLCPDGADKAFAAGPQQDRHAQIVKQA